MIFVLNEAKKLLHRKSGAGHFEIVQFFFCFVPARCRLGVVHFLLQRCWLCHPKILHNSRIMLYYLRLAYRYDSRFFKPKLHHGHIYACFETELGNSRLRHAPLISVPCTVML